jgi:polysaccharide biosynthesis/export protein
MTQKISSLFLFYICLALVSMLVSCATRNKVIYFYNTPNINSKDSSISYTPILKADDLLGINVSSIDVEAAKPFNLSVVSYSTNGQVTGVPTVQGFLINSDGTIDFPVIGKIKLAGLSRTEATDLLKDKLKDYITNPIVNIKILNFKVTVIGEVRSPGTYTIPNERITILEAIGLAGDLNITGVRKNVLVIREINGKKTGFRVDLTSDNVINSPVYYLNQNDVIYIEPNKAKVNSANSSANISIVLSSISVLISSIYLILTLSKK